jgi:hypothetical protein
VRACCCAPLRHFSEVKPPMPLHRVNAFLMVVADEGNGVREYAGKAGWSPSVMTQELLRLGDRKGVVSGAGLITHQRDSNDLTRSLSFGTAEGKAVMDRVVAALKP